MGNKELCMKRDLWNGRVGVGMMAALAGGCWGLSLPAQAQVKLEQKYPPGRVLKHKTIGKTHQILTLNGMPIETESTRTVLTDEAVGKPREDSTTPLTIKIDSLKIDLALP